MRLTRGYWIALLIAALNIAVMLCFPPYDYVSLRHGNVPTFDGFFFRFQVHSSRQINSNFLILEIIVVLVNLAIAWLLIGARSAPSRPVRLVNRAQKWLLLAVAINLTAMLLFPPFENFMAVTKAAIPSFEGFFFVFGNNSQRQIVTALLYLEVMVLLVNAGLLWLFLRDSDSDEMSPERMAELARGIQLAQKRQQSL